MSEEQERTHARERLTDALGNQAAEYIMSVLPPTYWHELARKADLEPLATKADLERYATKEDLERFATKEDLERFATKDELAEVRNEVAEVKNEVADLRKDTRHFADMVGVKMDALRHELLGAMHEQVGMALVSQTRITVIALVSAVVAVTGITTGLHTLA